MKGIKVKYWEGRTPPAEYFQMPDYSRTPECTINLRELAAYARATGKAIIDMTYEEVQQFAITPKDK